MREIKVRYVLRFYSKATNEVVTIFKVFKLSQLELGVVEALDYENYNKLEILGRDLFTGLKDKNGKEIYAGDIVKGYIPDIKGKVWNKEVFWSDVFDGWAFRSGKKKILHNDRSFYMCEVIGNIYENPELLEGK